MSPEESTAENLGPWSETSFHLRGDLDIGPGEVSFGVAHRNGLPQPWAFGPKPGTPLGENPSLSGSVTWRGAMVGVTPAGEGVIADATLVLEMKDMLGRSEFTGMRHESGPVWGRRRPSLFGSRGVARKDRLHGPERREREHLRARG